MRATKSILSAVLVMVLLAALPAPVLASRGQDSGSVVEYVLYILRTHHLYPMDEETEMRLLEEVIQAYIRALDDPYTSYLSPEELEAFVERLEPEYRYGGVGIVVEQIGDYITVLAPIPGSPAEAAGIEPRDRITEVDGESLVGEPLEKAVYLMRGEPGTSVTLIVRREGEYLEVTMVREEIVVPMVESEMMEHGIGYISVGNFALETPDMIEAAVRYLELEGATSLVLDLRRNAGGYLEPALQVADLFLEQGDTLIHIYDRHGLAESHISWADPITDLPLVVLIDEGSASASEIVVAALRDAQRATVLGMQTFGKGTIQSLLPLPTGAVLKFTTAEFRTPRGRGVESAGIMPDILIADREAQIGRAVMLLGPGVSQRVRLLLDRNLMVSDGQLILLTWAGLMEIDGVHHILLRETAEVFGFSVLWDEDEGRVRLLDDARLIEFHPERDDVWVNGGLQVRRYSTFVRDGRTYVCLGFLQDLMGLLAEQEPGGRWIDLVR